MKVLILDTETTGTPKNYKAPIKDLDNWPRVIQLAWEFVDFDTQQVEGMDRRLVLPDGWEIPKEKFWIDNGYSTEKSNESGMPMSVLLQEMINAINQADILVAHNMGFDYPILAAEMIRYGLSAEKNERRIKICTMLESINFCKLPGNFRGQFKWPKLEELYRKLFNSEFENAHDAGADVAACRKCFFELVKLQIIKIPIYEQSTVLDGKAKNEIGGEKTGRIEATGSKS